MSTNLTTVTFDSTKWKLVPEEPTKEMLHAIWTYGPFSNAQLTASYGDLLAATPTPPLSPTPDTTGRFIGDGLEPRPWCELHHKKYTTPTCPVCGIGEMTACRGPVPEEVSPSPASAPRVLSARLISWEPGSAGGVALVFSDGLECAMPLEGKAMPSRDLSAEEVSELLRQACANVGGQAAFAAKHDLSKQYVNNVCNGQREPGQSVAEALGLHRRVVFSSTPDSTGPAGATERESEAPIYEAFARYVGNADERASDFRMFATGYHAALTPSAPIAAPARERARKRIQALGAALSRRDWSDTERAYEAIRDAHDRPEIYDAPLIVSPGDAQTQEGWQPMETAPRDGTWILGWQDESFRYGGKPANVVRWHEDCWTGWKREDSKFPTQWRHLPDGPEAQTHEGGR